MLSFRKAMFKVGRRFSSLSAKEATPSPSKYPQLRAQVRTVLGSNSSRTLRAKKLVPGVLLGVDENRNVVKVLLQVDMIALNREIRKYGVSFENTIYELILNDEKYLVTPRQLQVHPGKSSQSFTVKVTMF